MSAISFTGSEVLRYRLYTSKQKTMIWTEQNDGEIITSRRAITAPTNARQKEKMRLIGALRRLIKPVTSVVATKDGGEDVELNGRRAWGKLDEVQPLSVEAGNVTPRSRPTRSCHQTRGYLQQSLVSASSIPASPDVPPARHGMPTNKSYNGDVTRGYGDLERIIATHNKSTKQGRLTSGEETDDLTVTKEKKRGGDKPKPYSQQLRILQGKKQNLLRISTDNSSTQVINDEDNLEVGGVSIHDSQDTAPMAAQSLSTTRSITSYNNMLSYTRKRLDKAGITSQARPLTHTTNRPAIVIPCHVNIECTYCQLYDEDHALHSERATPDLPVLKEPPSPKLVPPIVFSMQGNHDASMQQTPLTNRRRLVNIKKNSAKYSEKTTPPNIVSPKLDLSPLTIRSSSTQSSRSSVGSSTPSPTVKTVKMDDKCPELGLLDKSSQQNVHDIQLNLNLPASKKGHKKMSESNKPATVAPKIYKLKYTKASNPSIGRVDLGVDTQVVW